MDIKLTKIIDQYIQGEMSEADRKAFEERFENYPTLKAEYQLQLAIAEVAKRSYLQQRIQQRAQRYHLLKTLKIVAIIVAISTLAASAIYFSFANSTPPTTEDENFISTENSKENVNYDGLINNLELQEFEVPEGGALLFSKNGVMISVPDSAFLMNGKAFSGEVNIAFQEAISPAEIILAGLSTVNNNNLLETQGMFSFSAKTSTGDSLTINPEVGIYFEVPVDELKEGMQLYDGEKDAQGEINWVNPVPLRKIPVLADMSDLDFYPNKYEPTLDSLKWFPSKQKRDSLYLSMEEFNSVNNLEESSEPELDTRIKTKDVQENFPLTIGDTIYTMENSVDFEGVLTASLSPEFISPSKVLAFWDKKYNNTNLSTLAFQRRMQAIHNTCDNRVLDLYVNGLNRELVDIDKQVVGLGYTPFKEFVKENIGKIDMGEAHVRSLRNFYAKTAEALKTEAQENARAEREKNLKKDRAYQNSQRRNVFSNNKIKQETLQEEYLINLAKFGYPSRNSVGFTLRRGNNQIKNLDKLVWDATVARTNFKGKHYTTGEEVNLTYKPAFLQIQSSLKMDHQYAYFLPKQLSSYHKQMLINDTVSYKLNMDIQYDLLVVGVKNDDFYVEYRSSIAPQNYSIPLATAYTRAAADSLINSVCSSAKKMQSDLKNELKFFEERRAYQVHKTKQKEMEQFRRHIAKQIFPCYVEEPVVETVNKIELY